MPIEMNSIEFCAGAGGQALGLEQAGPQRRDGDHQQRHQRQHHGGGEIEQLEAHREAAAERAEHDRTRTGALAGDGVEAAGVDEALRECGGLGLWPGKNTPFTAYGNDATPPLKNGFSTGEGFRVKVWKAALNQIFDVTAQYAPVGTAGFVTHTSQFADDGISMMLSVTTAVTQACPLTTGWNMISSYIEPAHPDILDVFAPLALHVSIIKDGLGVSAIPSIPINGIGNWNVLKGYQVKSTQPDTLILIGQKVVPENTPIPLTTGWQIISYLRDSPQNAATVFGALSGYSSASISPMEVLIIICGY